MVLADELRETTWRAVHFLSPHEETDLAARLGGSLLAVFEADGEHMATKDGLLAEVARAMHFPHDFGMNWDALDDYLRDLAWEPSGGYILIVRNADSLWSSASHLAGMLIESWLLAAEFWGKRDKPFHLVFVW